MPNKNKAKVTAKTVKVAASSKTAKTKTASKVNVSKSKTTKPTKVVSKTSKSPRKTTRTSTSTTPTPVITPELVPSTETPAIESRCSMPICRW